MTKLDRIGIVSAPLLVVHTDRDLLAAARFLSDVAGMNGIMQITGDDLRIG